MKKTIFIILCLTLVLPSFAKDYYFAEISTRANVLNNSDIFVQENYTYSFEGQFTYVYRSFFLRNIKEIKDFKVWNAETGEDYDFSMTYDGGDLLFRWDIDALNENQTYVMEYVIVGAITNFNETNDYLWYSVVPVDREKRIDDVIFHINFPQGVGNSIPVVMSRDTEVLSISDRNFVFFVEDIEPYGTFDLGFYIPKGMVETYLTITDILLIVLPIIFTAINIIFPLILVFLGLQGYMKHGRDPKFKEFKKLPNLRPAVAGYVVDEKIDIKEIEATILDLSIRGFIYIHEKEEGTIFKRKEIVLVKLKSSKKLLGYESKIVSAIFGNKKKVEVSSLKNKFYKEIPDIKKFIQKEAEKLGLFDKKEKKKREEYKKKFVAVLITFFIAIFALTVISLPTFVLAAIFLFSGILNFMFMIALFVIFDDIVKRKTELGVGHANKYSELRDWMKKYPLKEGRLFDEYLPYATSLGIQRVWIKKLKDLEGEYKSGWYGGTYNRTSFLVLHNSLNSSFAAPGSSGGGGGGFGGGGGAGGGGAGAG